MTNISSTVKKCKNFLNVVMCFQLFIILAHATVETKTKHYLRLCMFAWNQGKPWSANPEAHNEAITK